MDYAEGGDLWSKINNQIKSKAQAGAGGGEGQAGYFSDDQVLTWFA